MQYDANEFYPTPPELIADMLAGISLDSIRTVLEPNAGKGDINQYFLVNDSPERLLPLCG